MSKKPNIIWMIADDVNPGMLSCFGGQALSPTIDSIAAKGALFRDFHCNAPACMPSRYGYLTGHYGGRCPAEQFRKDIEPGGPYKMWFNTALDPAREKCLGHALQQAGYKTGYVGKWHTGAPPSALEGMPRFKPDADPRDPAVSERMRQQQAHLAGIVRQNGFDYAASIIWGNHESLMPEAKWHNLEWITQGALDFVDQCIQEDDRFFLCVAPTTIHAPDHAASLLSDPCVTGGGYSDKHLGCQASRRSVYERLRDARGVEFNHTTAGILWMDDSLRAVLERIRAAGLEDDTIVIFTTEHGPSVGGKFTLYETGTRIPFVMQWPNGFRGGQQIHAMVQNIDFLPTLLEAAGAGLPADMVVDGRSFLPLLQGSGAGRDDLFFEFGYARAVRTDKWKYIAWRPPAAMLEGWRSGNAPDLCTIFGRPVRRDRKRPDLLTPTLMRYRHYFAPDQLYDLEADPGEQNNLAHDEACAPVLSDMRQRLRAYLDSFDDVFDVDAIDPFCASAQFEAMQREVFGRIDKERDPWEAEAKANGLYATAQM